MRKCLSVLVGIAVLALATGTVAHEMRFKAIVVVHPWVLETDQTQADLHLKIKNTGTVTERLLRVSTRLAASALLVEANGRRVNDVVIPDRGELTLQPGGAHIALSGLKKPLRPYDSFDLTLVFEKVGAVEVEVLVEEKTSDAWRTAPRNTRFTQGFSTDNLKAISDLAAGMSGGLELAALVGGNASDI